MARMDSIAYILIALASICVFQSISVVFSYWSVDEWIRADAQHLWAAEQRLGDTGSRGKMPALQVSGSKVQYSYWVDGTQYYGIARASDGTNRYMSSSFDVFYNPSDPEISTTTRSLPWGIVGMWLIFTIASLSALYGWVRIKVKYEKP